MLLILSLLAFIAKVSSQDTHISLKGLMPTDQVVIEFDKVLKHGKINKKYLSGATATYLQKGMKMSIKQANVMSGGVSYRDTILSDFVDWTDSSNNQYFASILTMNNEYNSLQ